MTTDDWDFDEEAEEDLSPEKLFAKAEARVAGIQGLLEELNRSVLSAATLADMQQAIEKGIQLLCDEAEDHMFTPFEGIIRRETLERRFRGFQSKKDFAARFEAMAKDLRESLDDALAATALELYTKPDDQR